MGEEIRIDSLQTLPLMSSLSLQQGEHGIQS